MLHPYQLPGIIMKRLLALSLMIAAGFSAACTPEGRGAPVVRTDAILLGTEAGADHGLTLYQDSSLSDFTFVFFRHGYDGTNVTLRGLNTALDEGSDWFFMRKGEVIGRDQVLNGSLASRAFISGTANDSVKFSTVTFSPILDFNNGLEEGPHDFYVGVSSPSGYFVGPRSPNAFGWARFEILVPSAPVPAGLRLVDSAVAYFRSGPIGGIVVGSQTIVPEPSTMLQGVLIGLLGLVSLRFRNRARSGRIASE
jgi:hypothetical protein